MKLFLSAAVTALVMLATPTFAIDFAWGAHNPSQVDHPDIPNCTVLDGPNNYANNPNCETVPGGLGSMVSHVTAYTPRPDCGENEYWSSMWQKCVCYRPTSTERVSK